MEERLMGRERGCWTAGGAESTKVDEGEVEMVGAG
jgi:hypothetical protein